MSKVNAEGMTRRLRECVGWLNEQHEPATVADCAKAWGAHVREARRRLARLNERNMAICVNPGGSPGLWVSL